MLKRILVSLLLALLVLTASCADTVQPAPSSAPAGDSSAPAASEPAFSSEAPEESVEASVEESVEESEEPFDASPLFELVQVEEVFDIHAAPQQMYLLDTVESITDYCNGWNESSKPRPVPLEWRFLTELLPEGYTAPGSFEVLLATDADFTDPRVITAYTEADGVYKAEVTNLFIGTDYYWKIVALCGEETLESAVSSFSTASAAPRNLDIDGVSNVRDVGGRAIDEHHRVRQGMIYRGAAFEDLKYDTHITEEGVRQALEELHIKTEIELRWIKVGEIESRQDSLLGDTVNYYEYQFSYNDTELVFGNLDSINKCFRVFADETQYPIYYHCRIGTDRTGALSFLLLASLGVDKESILRDYLFSNFGYVGGNRNLGIIKNAYLDAIEAMEGETLQDKVTLFLKTKCYVSDETLDKIKALMIEEY